MLLLAGLVSWLFYFKPLLGWDDYWQDPEWDPPVAYEVAELDAKEFSKLLAQLSELKKDSDKDYKKHEEKTIQIVENITSSSSSSSGKQPLLLKEIEIEDLNPKQQNREEEKIEKDNLKVDEEKSSNVVQEVEDNDSSDNK